MATDPSKGMRDYGLAAERAAKDVDKIAERIRASLERAHKKLGADFNAEMRFMVSAFKQGTKEMDVTAGTLPKSMERAFAQMGAITDRGGKKILNLKRAIESVGTFLPKALGINAFAILQSTVANAAAMDAEFVTKHAAIGARSEAIVKAFTGEGEAARRAFDIIQAGRQYQLTGAIEVYKQEVAQARGNSAAILAAKTKLADSVRAIDKRTQSERARAQMSDAGRMAADASARRVPAGARGVMSATGGYDATSVLQMIPSVQRLAAAEKQVAQARSEGKDASLSIGQRGMSELLGAVTKLTAGITPMTVMASVIMEIVQAFSRMKVGGAAAMEAVAVQGPLRSANTLGLVADAAMRASNETQQLRRELGPIGSAVNVDALWVSATKASRTMGGLGENVFGVTAGLAAIQAMAPLAGMDASSAMGMVAKGQRAFSMKNKTDVKEYFLGILSGARAAGMGVEDFMSSMGDINQMGMQWGLSIDKIVGKGGAMTKLMAGLPAASLPGVRGMVAGAFTSLSNLSLGQTMAMRMAGGRANAEQAFRAIRTEQNPILGNVRAFREMIKMQHPGGFDNERDRMKLAFRMENAFGTNFAKAMMRDEKTFKAFLQGTNENSKDFQEAMKRAQRDADPLRAAAEIGQLQKDILEQIRDTIVEFMQGVLQSAIFRTFNPAATQALARQTSLHQALTAPNAK